MINQKLSTNFNLHEWFKSDLELSRFEKLSSNTQNLYLTNIRIVAAKLQMFRDYKKKPIIILSGWRSLYHNSFVGGAKNSYHLIGSATDIYYQGIEKEYLKDSLQLQYIFPGVLYYPNSKFFHCDIRSYKYVNLSYK